MQLSSSPGLARHAERLGACGLNLLRSVSLYISYLSKSPQAGRGIALGVLSLESSLPLRAIPKTQKLAQMSTPPQMSGLRL